MILVFLVRDNGFLTIHKLLLNHPQKGWFFIFTYNIYDKQYNIMVKKTITSIQNSYAKPTPEKWRKLGDALLGVSTTITGFAIYEDAKWVAISALLIGAVGKFLTDFFSQD